MNGDSHAELVRQLGLVAADLERRMYPHVGVLRRAARALLVVPVTAPAGGCDNCGDPIAYSGRGRPRRFCTHCAPPKKKPGNDSLAA